MPKLVTSAVWALKPWPITVQIGHEQVTIPALSAADWLSVLMEDPIDLEQVFPGLADAEDLVDEALFEGQLSLDDLYDIGLDCITAASARPWYVAIRLSQIAQAGWDNLGGELALAGVDASRMPLAQWFDALHLIILRTMDPKSHTMFHSQLEMPPPGVQVDESAMEMSRDQFMGMMSG